MKDKQIKMQLAKRLGELVVKWAFVIVIDLEKSIETPQIFFTFSGKVYGFFQSIGSKIKNAFNCVKDAIFGS